MSKLQWIGQAEAIDLKAWEAYLTALRDNLNQSWARAVSAYNGLKQVRTTLGLPFIIPAGSPEQGAPAGMSLHAGWLADLDQQAVDIGAMVKIVTSALDDVIAAKRRLNWNATTAQWEIESLPGDLLRIDIQGAGLPGSPQIPVLISTATGNPTHVEGQVGVGVPAIVWAATLTASALALPAYWLVEQAVNTLTDVAEQRTLRTIAEKSYECVQSGKCSPDDAAKINQSIYQGATAIRQQKVEEQKAKNKPTTDITSAITTVAWVALGIAALYVVARLIPSASARSQRATTRRELALAP